MDQERRQVQRGQGRLLRVRRAVGRHAEGLGHLRLPGGSRGGARRTRSGARGGGGRRRRREQARQAQGVRGAQARQAGGRCAEAGAAAARQGQARAVQVSALDRVPQRAAQDGDGKDPAVQAAKLRGAVAKKKLSASQRSALGFAVLVVGLAVVALGLHLLEPKVDKFAAGEFVLLPVGATIAFGGALAVLPQSFTRMRSL